MKQLLLLADISEIMPAHDTEINTTKTPAYIEQESMIFKNFWHIFVYS